MSDKALDEQVYEMENEERIIHKDTELGSVMKNLDSDKIDRITKMSDIDFNARLRDVEINACLVFDELMRLGILPSDSGLTRQKKRLSVSRDGLGREEKVRIVQGDREQVSGVKGFKGFANMFKRGE